MMIREAAWLGSFLAAFDTADLDPILSIGSGTADFRRRFQPWIEPAVYEPLAARGVRVLHHEMHAAEGIDVVGDLGDDAVRADLAARGVRCILCLNVFEHVDDRPGLARSLVAALPVGGLLVVTVPRRFPYHPDPLDTMYRPTGDELASLFDGVEVVATGQVRCEPLYRHWLAKPGKLGAVRKLLRRPADGGAGTNTGSTPSPAPAGPPTDLRALASMAVVSTEVSYAVLRRTS